MDSLAIDDTFAVAVSGGIDSMVLLNLIAEYLLSTKSAKNAVVLTVNHGLRLEAEYEVKFVLNESKKLGFKCYILSNKGEAVKGNVQSKARIIRYELMYNCCKNNKIKHLLLAHHQNDQVETILMRIERGSGIDGLVGMKKSVLINDVIIHRPLLDFTRSEISDYAHRKQIVWINDNSNNDLSYKRVVYRNLLRKENDFSVLAKRICLTAVHAERALFAILHYVRISIDLCIEISDLGYLSIKLSEFSNLPEEIACRLLMYSLMSIAQNKYKPRYKKFVILFNKIWLNKFIKAQTFYGCKIVRVDSRICIYRELCRIEDRLVDLNIDREIVWDGRFLLRIEGILVGEVTVSALGNDCLVPAHLKGYSNDITSVLPILKCGNEVVGYLVENNDFIDSNFLSIKILKILLRQSLLDLTNCKITM